MFSPEDFARLQFLVGRWKGHSADGKEFYEEYGRTAPDVFQSHRYASAAFDGRSDGSTIHWAACPRSSDGSAIQRGGRATAQRPHDDPVGDMPARQRRQYDPANNVPITHRRQYDPDGSTSTTR